MHKWNAARRGIQFLLTFEEWWSIWQASGCWHERGRGKGKYCMARYRDRGSYEIGNVRVCLNEENRAEYIPTLAYRARLSAAKRGNKHKLGHLGHRHTAETRAKMSVAAYARRSRRDNGRIL
jgi:hypothetical protein